MLGNSFKMEHAVIIRLAAVLIFILIGGAAFAAEENTKSEEAAVVDEAVVGDTYPLETCIVTGAKLGAMGEPVVYDCKGREIRFCCGGCIKKFEEDPEAYIEKMDKAIIAMEVENYPLGTCVVSGKNLGSMGKPVDFVYDNHLVRFCCGGCIKAFEKDPDKYTAKIDEARARQAAEAAPKPYPLETCIVSGGKLGSMGEPVSRVYKGQEVKFCCAGCIPSFESDPDKYMEKLPPVGSEPAEATHDHKNCGGH
jgi:YHS domain-containing protein